MKEQYLKKDHLLAGHMVSADHHILQSPGSLYHKKVNQIHMICSQEDVSLLTITVFM